MSRPYLCMDVMQRWRWMGGDEPDYRRRVSAIEAECRDLWAEAGKRFETSSNMIRAIEILPTLAFIESIDQLWCNFAAKTLRRRRSLADGKRLLHTGGPR